MAVASLVEELRALGEQASVVVARGLSCPMAMWDLPGLGIEPVSPALAGRFLTTGPPGNPLLVCLCTLPSALTPPTSGSLTSLY